VSNRHPLDSGHPPGDLSRRDLLAIVGVGAVASALAGCSGRSVPAAPAQQLADPIYFSSVRALRDAMGRGAISSEELTRAFLDRIGAVNPTLNAVVQLDAEGALARAREADQARSRGEVWGPLHGIPMTIKDSLDTAGMITTGGTLGRASFRPEADATVVARVRAAGAILLGKTNTPELTLSFETDNLVYGKTNNPYDAARTPGGSSGGAAAILAAGGSAFDIGSDYGGSIRLPAHFCGIAGIKPTTGRVPRTGHIYPFGGLTDTCQQIGPLARTVGDLALLLPIIMGPDFVDPAIYPMPWTDPATLDLRGLRLAVHTDNGIATPTEATIATVAAAADALRMYGTTVDEARPTGVEQALAVGLPVYFADGGAANRRLLKAAGTTKVSPQLAGAGSPALSAEELDKALDRWFKWRSGMLGFLERYDAIVCPVNAGPAVTHGTTADPNTLAAFSYTMTYNLTGWPGAVVRAGTSPEGLPIGVQIVARPGREDVALALAQRVEDALGGFRPPVA